MISIFLDQLQVFLHTNLTVFGAFMGHLLRLWLQLWDRCFEHKALLCLIRDGGIIVSMVLLVMMLFGVW
jgi:hypothetical protein